MEEEIELNRDPMTILMDYTNHCEKTVNELQQFIDQANASGLKVPNEVQYLLEDKNREFKSMTSTLAKVQAREHQLQ
ncbi:hypothetical protein GJ688_17885 [Heliobacillus mobilis]|uniref:Uncharacterized protein n=1 Tax=Heliobacterium mobile TaxID=28064 RepID=A0A6I3SQ34_HELMO|nr:hypothetical protein [Heliobacterium mobile]MTV50805.1 hypothetical protein [Heliobacterium mobile]